MSNTSSMARDIAIKSTTALLEEFREIGGSRPLKKLSAYLGPEDEQQSDEIKVEIVTSIDQEIRADITQEILFNARQCRPCATYDFLSISAFILSDVFIERFNDFRMRLQSCIDDLPGARIILSPTALTMIQCQGLITRTSGEGRKDSLPLIGHLGKTPIHIDAYAGGNVSLLIVGDGWLHCTGKVTSPDEVHFSSDFQPMINPVFIRVIDFTLERPSCW